MTPLFGHTYFAMGARYFHIYQHNHSQTVFRTKSGNGLGLFVNTGFNYIFCDHYLVDIFGEYSYAKSPFDNGRCCIYTRNIQVGGLTFGAGLGYAF